MATTGKVIRWRSDSSDAHLPIAFSHPGPASPSSALEWATADEENQIQDLPEGLTRAGGTPGGVCAPGSPRRIVHWGQVKGALLLYMLTHEITSPPPMTIPPCFASSQVSKEARTTCEGAPPSVIPALPHETAQLTPHTLILTFSQGGISSRDVVLLQEGSNAEF